MKNKSIQLLVLFVIALCSSAAQAYWFPVRLSFFSPVELPPYATSIVGAEANVLYGSTDWLVGVDVGSVQHVKRDAYGAMGGICNVLDGDLVGLEGALVNWTEGNANGFQVGFFNCCRGTTRGFQIGLINSTEKMAGLQIGLLNFIWESPMTGFPIVNSYF